MEGELCFIDRLGLLDIVKIFFLLESVLLSVIPINIPAGFFMEFDNSVLKCMNSNKVEKLTVSDTKLTILLMVLKRV